MLSDKLLKSLNEQINNELFAAYQYLAMAEYFAAQNLDGFAHWMRLQREEEITHAMKIFDFGIDRDARVTLAPNAAPDAKFASPLAVLKKALQHERSVTAKINALYAAAKKENDYPTEAIMQWFVLEQVEEEASALQIVEQLEMVGDSAAALLMLDRQMAGRTAGG